MLKHRGLCKAAAVLMVLHVTGSLLAADGNVTVPEQIEQQQPAFYVRASVDHKNRVYREGDALTLKVVSERDAFLYMLYRQSDDKIYQVFPNSAHRDNRVKAKQAVELGGGDDLFRWIIGAPFGKEVITVIASTEPIEELTRKEQIARQFNPVTVKQIESVAKSIETTAAHTWASTHLPIETRPKTAPPDPPVAKRFGLFIGVSQHRYAQEEKELNQEGRTSDVPGPEEGAREMASLMRENGELDETRLLVNAGATRSNIEQALTQWLPTATKAGDTIFIYFCGHTAKIPDDNHDEADGEDEILSPHDSMSLPILLQAFMNDKAGKLSADKRDHYRQMLTAIAHQRRIVTPRDQPPYIRALRAIGELIEQKDMKTLDTINQTVVRSSSLSDDLMGQWLQRLDGRRVVVIFDTCFAAGHATAGKVKGFPAPTQAALPATDEQASLAASAQRLLAERRSAPEPGRAPKSPIDFLDSEALRLKDIGQRDLALLASSSSSLTSLVRPDKFPGDKGPFGLFTSGVVDAITTADAPVSIEDIHKHAAGVMQDFFRRAPDWEAREPYLWSDLTSPVYLKP